VIEGWEIKKLGSVAFLQRGFDLPAKNRVKGKIPVISSAGISGFHNKAQADSPGVVTGRYGSIGEVFYVEEDYWPLNTALWVKNFFGNDPKFIYYVLSRIDYKKFSGKTGVPGVNRNDLHSIKISLPPLSEQKKISQILSTWDKAVKAVEGLIENSKTQKKALMSQLLTGKTRLEKLGSQALGFVKLGSLCAVRRGASPRPIQDSKWFSEKGRGWVRISDVTASSTEFLESTSQYLSSLGAKKSVPVEPGELIMSICATIGVPKIVGIPVCIHDGFVVFRDMKDDLAVEFLYYYLWFASEKLANSGQPGTQKNLNIAMVKNILIPFMSLEEQQKIAKILSAADKEIRLLEKEKTFIKQQKKILLQQLLTGKHRVVLDDPVPESEPA